MNQNFFHIEVNLILKENGRFVFNFVMREGVRLAAVSPAPLPFGQTRTNAPNAALCGILIDIGVIANWLLWKTVEKRISSTTPRLFGVPLRCGKCKIFASQFLLTNWFCTEAFVLYSKCALAGQATCESADCSNSTSWNEFHKFNALLHLNSLQITSRFRRIFIWHTWTAKLVEASF